MIRLYTPRAAVGGLSASLLNGRGVTLDGTLNATLYFKDLCLDVIVCGCIIPKYHTA